MPLSSSSDSSEFHTVTEVAHRLRVSDKTVRREIERGRLRVARIGKGRRHARIRISEADLQAYLTGPAAA